MSKILIYCTMYRPSIRGGTRYFYLPKTEFVKLHMGLVVLVKKMSVLINFLLQNTILVSVLSKICPNFAGHV